MCDFLQDEHAREEDKSEREQRGTAPRRGFLPVHEEGHLGGEALAAVHAQVPVHAQVGAQVGLHRALFLEDPATLGAFVRALLVHALVRFEAVGGDERAAAQRALLRLGRCRRFLLRRYESVGLSYGVVRLVRQFPAPRGFLKAAHEPPVRTLFFLSQEVLPLVLEEVLRCLEEKGAFGAFVRLDDHHLSHRLLGTGKDSGGQRQHHLADGAVRRGASFTP